MFFKLLLGTVFALSTFFLQPTNAQENPILFWGTTCPYCHVVRGQIEEQGIKEKISIEELEIYENEDNLKIFREKIEVCKIDPNSAGVPLLYFDEECFTGPNAIMAQLTEMVGEGFEVEEDLENGKEEIVVGADEEGKRNTEIFLVMVVALLFSLVLVGYLLQKKKGKVVTSILLITTAMLLSSTPSYAICPVCTVAVGAGLGFSRYFGIDDVITGVWIGGLVVSSIMWVLDILKRKDIKNWVWKTLVPVSTYAFLGLTLYLLDFVGHPLNTLWGVDKIVLGILSGSIIFYLFARLHLYLKEKNDGKVYIPFQKVIFTVGSLLILTVLFYLLVY